MFNQLESVQELMTDLLESRVIPMTAEIFAEMRDELMARGFTREETMELLIAHGAGVKNA